ncbi:hypothetical protein PT974_02673 [Cladobotryum mycophilum]|uniref:Chromosome transmission fidelity protein 4 n=1 Tax=Cladobotryum mycophilum TaxID=491253 RepID=A0ABR0SYR5_9HYPO
MAAPLRTTLTSPSGRCCLSSIRHLTSFSPAKAKAQPITHPIPETQQPILPPPPPPPRNVLNSSSPTRRLSKTYFEASDVLWMGGPGEQPSDPNKAKLGKTLSAENTTRTPPDASPIPLPQDILAPNISLQLFPSTHPHLPTVSGRVAYNAALWTSPIAWNRVPLIGNVKLEILAERMTSEPLTFLPRRAGAIPEQLLVRWCEKRKCAEERQTRSGGGSISIPLRLNRGVDPNKAFTGLFIFDFDKEGRVLTHTIEQVQEGGDWEKGMGAKFVGLTDWLLGGMRDPGETPIPMFERKRRHGF